MHNRRRRYNSNMVNRKARGLPKDRTVTLPGRLGEAWEPWKQTTPSTAPVQDRDFKPNPDEPRPDFSVLRRRNDPHVLHTEDGPPTSVHRIEADGEPPVSEIDMAHRPFKRLTGSRAYRTMGHVEKGWVNYDAMRKDSRFYRTPLDD